MIWGIDPDTATALVAGIAERWRNDVAERTLRHASSGDVTHRH